MNLNFNLGNNPGLPNTETTPSEIAIQCEGVTRRFGGVPAVSGVTFRAPRGSILALLGPSGCGKTTLLRMIAGYDRPDEGSITIRGRAVVGPKVWVEPEKRHIGFVFQDYALFPHLSVAANVAFGVRGTSRAERRERVLRMLALVGLEASANRMPHELSGGMQQRVALARALAPDPDVVLLDEPFSNLDAGLRRQIREDVHRILRAARATAVFVTHDQEEALSLGDLVAVMSQGQILEIGAPRELYLNPRRRETAEIIGAVNKLRGESLGVTVRCALGQLPVAKPCRTGPMEVILRPEAIQLRPFSPYAMEPGRDLGSHAVGEVEALQFHGSHQHICVRLTTGERLRVRVGPEQFFKVGQSVVARAPEPALCFAADGASRMELSEPDGA